MKLEPNLPPHITEAPRQSRSPDILREQVRSAVDGYFTQLNGHAVSNLYELFMKEVEEPLLEAVLRHCDNNQTQAAKALGISRSTLRKKMGQYELD